ncbi:hypothetical protein CEP54_014506 [Fusarium duplospermum]|uniref:Uncharacterized protein n=1 Tax=Fusarium duplospermum TaxID=1325734 RepID=A0A428NVM4_9HYPO|nr:hypothetical protein CEP54_014506 [Fusarium duplospermum]
MTPSPTDLSLGEELQHGEALCPDPDRGAAPAPLPIRTDVSQTELSGWDRLYNQCIEADPAFGTHDALSWLERLVSPTSLWPSHCHLVFAVGMIPDSPTVCTPLTRCIYRYRWELLQAENRHPTLTELLHFFNCTQWDQHMRTAAAAYDIDPDFEFPVQPSTPVADMPDPWQPQLSPALSPEQQQSGRLKRRTDDNLLMHRRAAS